MWRISGPSPVLRMAASSSLAASCSSFSCMAICTPAVRTPLASHGTSTSTITMIWTVSGKACVISSIRPRHNRERVSVLEILISLQGWIQGSLSTALSTFATSRDWTLLAAMLPMGVAFGAIHALTPGHGKTILSSYLVGSRLGGLRGLIVAGSLSLTHVGSAVVISLLALPLVSRSLGGAGQAPSLEVLSRGFLALIGLWLLIRALRT